MKRQGFDGQGLLSRAEEMGSFGLTITTVTANGAEDYWSDGMFRIAGRDPRYGPPSHAAFLTMLHPDDRDEFEELQGGASMTWRLVRPDGTQRHILSRRSVEVGEGGEATRRFDINTDVTEQLAWEEELRKMQKMRAIGTLASGVAHDFNNLLMGVSGCTELALNRLPPDHPSYSYLMEVREAASRGARLTRQLLTFSRGYVMKLEPVRLDDLVERTEPKIHGLIGEDVDLTVSLNADESYVQADVTHLEQVVINLALNGRDAMPNGGFLRIETEREDGVVVLRVADEGHGIDDTIRERIFEPFFTTKPPGAGSGLGLAMAFAVVDELGGRIDLHSSHAGTVVAIRLPRLETTDEIATV